MRASVAAVSVAGDFELTTFPNENGYDELVVVRDIPFRAQYGGIAHVGYLPGERILGLSKLARVVEMCARGRQMQEQMTANIADWLGERLQPRGHGVVVEAEHETGTRMVTSALHGVVRDDPRTREEFLRFVGRRTR